MEIAFNPTKILDQSFSTLETGIHLALGQLLSRDADLLRQDTSEWAIAHRLAVYLESQLSGWNIDCEYNRQGYGCDPKHNHDDKAIRPDIVVHHRGHGGPAHNLLVVEIKKHEEESDLGKACSYTDTPSENRPFQYQYGLALSFFPEVKLTWYSEGKKCI